MCDLRKTAGRRASLAVALALVVPSCGGSEVPVDFTRPPATDAITITSRDVTTSDVAPATTVEAQSASTALGGTLASTPDSSGSVRPASQDTPICSTGAGSLPPDGEPVRVILDTDFASDVDDVGALAVLHALADAGEVEILAVMVSNGGDAPVHRAIDSINTYYNRPDVPIGVVKGAAPAFPSAYVSALASEFSNDIGDPPAALDLYREILASEPDDSVTIVSVGYLTNLDALLSSPPDEASASSGVELVGAKVRRWVAMGGHYPDSSDHPFLAEFNFVEDATATLNSVADWPTPMVFSGFELGGIVLTGAVLQEQTPPENPVREAYRLFNGGENHFSWDLTAVLAAVRGTAGLFDVCSGRNVIGRGGGNTWEFDGAGPHGFLRLVVPAADVGSVLDGLLIAPPTRP